MTEQWGGQVQGSGSHRRRLNLDRVDEHAARDLATLMRKFRLARDAPNLTEEVVVMELVRRSMEKVHFIPNSFKDCYNREHSAEFQDMLKKKKDSIKITSGKAG